jgi:tetratricopeptide (TPR) repeat protein
VIDLGDATKAEELFGRALAIEEAVHGTKHVSVARTLNNLGSAYADLGDAAKAKELLEHALAIKEAAYGPAHVEVANTLGILGDAHPGLGNAAKARELCERADDPGGGTWAVRREVVRAVDPRQRVLRPGGRGFLCERE